jgi:hypothetical protein
MNKGQPCILDNKDVDNGKEEVVSMHYKHTHIHASVGAYVQEAC